MQNFNEWMSIRQANEPVATPGSFQFTGTYDLENMPNLVEDSEKLEIDEVKKLVPEQYHNQFGGMQDLIAGKAITEENQEIVWVCNESGVVYLFAKN